MISLALNSPSENVMSLQDEFNEKADDWFELLPGSYPSVPRTARGGQIAVRSLLPLVVDDTAALHAYPDDVEAALVILSQSPHARELAQIAIQNNYRIRMQDEAPGSVHADAFGSTDHLNRRIRISLHSDPLHMALRIAHELAHVAQGEKGFQFSALSADPVSSIRELRALEADARAHEFIVALELGYKTPEDPDERLIFPAAIDAVMDTIGAGQSKTVIEHYRPQFPDINRDEMMARIFKSFYYSFDLRAHYEATVVGTLTALDVVALQNPALFQEEWNSAALLKKLGGYAPKAEKYLDLDAPPMAAVGIESLHKLAALQARRRENPAVKDSRDWTDAFVLQAAPHVMPQKRAPAP